MAKQKNNTNTDNIDELEVIEVLDTSTIDEESKSVDKKVLENEVNTSSIEPQPEKVIVKKSGTALSLLAILIALSLGFIGYYGYQYTQGQMTDIEQKLASLKQKTENSVNFESSSQLNATLKQDKEQLEKLTIAFKEHSEKITELQREISIKDQSINALQTQINRLDSKTRAEQPNDWLLSEADFLLNNALRKLVLDNDIDTAVSLLKIADETLAKVSNPNTANIRVAINEDLKLLLSLNNIDQNAIMQRLSLLANTVDELSVLDVNFEQPKNDTTLSDSVTDWKENAGKSAVSFLNHFIRITPRNNDSKPLLAPNQDIYLRENIRLRLQLAIMAVPRQQNELYKQSLETVASWVRSYFDTNTETAQNFLKDIDELAEQSIYVDAPEQLNSLNILDKLLNKKTTEFNKVEISVDKSIKNTTDLAVEEKNRQ